MTTHYILADEAAIRKAKAEAEIWTDEASFYVCFSIIVEALVERDLNKRGFTQYKEKATYPK